MIKRFPSKNHSPKHHHRKYHAYVCSGINKQTLPFFAVKGKRGERFAVTGQGYFTGDGMTRRGGKLNNSVMSEDIFDQLFKGDIHIIL